ncbi:NitT/TauT family transport system permease protein [Maritimibacter alkaliphilus HTCC2654]|jgi:NitT/TauT family transport system permease protein|nr:ABC transporter permease subunit [Maritimibacter sp.]TYP85331.1 NitT/TauT family transport system permease protein [Maritimibacter alkaliphilus HTCC2654]
MAEAGRKPRSTRRWAEWASLPLLLLLWQVAAMLVAHRLFPTPVVVFGELYDLAAHGSLIADVTKTLGRAVLAFFAAMTMGVVIGGALGRFAWADGLFGNWILIGLNIPAIVVAITCYIWLGLTEFALILAVVINKTPLVAVNMREGVRALDHGLAELAKVYRVGFWRRVNKFIIPQLMPYVLTAARTGLSLIWKIVLVFEVLGSDGGVGFRIGIFFQHFDMKGILAYTLAFMAVVILIEYGVMRPLEHRVLGWRPARN